MTGKDANETHGLRTERKRILVGFGDIRGFGSWTARNSNSTEEFTHLIRDVYRRWFKFREDTDCFIKLVGDGIMFAKETNPHDAGILGIIKSVFDLTDETIAIIKKIPYPRPKGFRVRMVYGHAFRIRFNGHIDYLGYNVNLASRMLNIFPNYRHICHESVRELISGSKCVAFKKLPPVRRVPDGVDREDIENSWIINKKKNGGGFSGNTTENHAPHVLKES